MTRPRIKIILSRMILFAFLLTMLPVRVSAREEEKAVSDSLYAQSAVLMDGDSGRVLFGKEADTIRPMASTTKIMTCILALENMEEEQIAVVTAHAAEQPKVRLGVEEGETYYLKDILYSLMLESHNDSAVLTAEAIAGSVPAFAGMMNEKAKELGCADTHFVTPNGLDGSDDGGTHATTARDLARIMKYCIKESPKKDGFLSITQTPSYSFTNVEGNRSFTCSNHNAFLGMMDGALSGKTGFTGDAGYCYVGALERDGRTFIVALLACGWPNNKSYKWSDTKKLMTYGMEHYQYKNVWQNQETKPVCVENGIPDDGKVSGRSSVQTKLEEQELHVLLSDQEKVEVTVKTKPKIQAPVEKGAVVGTVIYLLNGRKIGEYPVTAAHRIEKRTLRWCFSQMAERLCNQ